MIVRAINWTMGNHGSVWLQLREGECRVDWGDGHTSSIKAPPYQDQNNMEWVYACHEYHKSCMETEQVFDVSISSEEDNIVGFLISFGEMMVQSIDFTECQELEYLKAGFLIENLDITTNPNIKKMELTGDAAVLADFSNSIGLEELILTISNRKSLNISKCIHLKHLDCSENYSMTKLSVSNKILLETFRYGNSPIEDKYLCFVKYKEC